MALASVWHSRPLPRAALVRWGVVLFAACNWNSMGPSSCVGSVTVAPPTATVRAGQTVQLYATVRDTAGQPLSGYTVTWASDKPSVATVDQSSGVVTGVSVGNASITATTDAQSGSAWITVTPAAAPQATQERPFPRRGPPVSSDAAIGRARPNW